MRNKIFIIGLLLFSVLNGFLFAQAPPPPYPTIDLKSPVGNAVLNTFTPSFLWKDTALITDLNLVVKYQLVIFDYAGENLIFHEDSIPVGDTTFSMTSPLAPGKYRWLVYGVDVTGSKNITVSNPSFFTILDQPPANFSLISPDNNGVSSDCVTEFTWHASKGNLTKYKFFISGLPSVTVAPTDTVLIYEFDIPDGPYQWFVTAYDTNGLTTNSDTFNFSKNGKVNTIWGYVQYDNNFNTKLSDVNLALLNSSGQTVLTTTSDNGGYFKFENVGNGSYSITADTKKPTGGIDPTDALLINRNYIKQYQFGDDMKKTAADVNADQKTNPIDALQVNRYYIKLIPEFKAGKWLFADGSFIVNCDGMLQINVRALCIGDVNGSYKPVK